MQFEKVVYTVKEKAGILHIPIIRMGDLTFKSSVRCYTRTMSAMVMDDFEERRNSDDSLITFHKGEKVLLMHMLSNRGFGSVTCLHCSIMCPCWNYLAQLTSSNYFAAGLWIRPCVQIGFLP